MIRQTLYIQPYDWVCHCYFAVDKYYVGEISEKLLMIGCDGDDYDRAVENMMSGQLDTGFCFSNSKNRVSVLVIALTSHASQFADSQSHEVRHLANNICSAFGIDLEGEESCYLQGWITRMMFPYVRDLLCDHCRCNVHVEE